MDHEIDLLGQGQIKDGGNPHFKVLKSSVHTTPSTFVRGFQKDPKIKCS